MLTEEQKHQAKFFIKKFEAIPEEQWCCGKITDSQGKHCALGHLGEFYSSPVLLKTNEGRTLEALFSANIPVKISEVSAVAHINDSGGNPKENILKFLYNLLKP